MTSDIRVSGIYCLTTNILYATIHYIGQLPVRPVKVYYPAREYFSQGVIETVSSQLRN